jgi:hypothetical protein
MKKYILSILASIPLLGIAGKSYGATSTVMLDPPDIASLINNIYSSANPIMTSLWGWIGVILGIIIVFGVIRWLFNAFRG